MSKLKLIAVSTALMLSSVVHAHAADSGLTLEADYMDGDVHVLIPKLLPETKLASGGKLLYYVKGGKQWETARNFDTRVVEAYKGRGAMLDPVKIFSSGETVD